MIYDLAGYTIILTFTYDWLQIDTENPQNAVGKLGVMCRYEDHDPLPHHHTPWLHVPEHHCF